MQSEWILYGEQLFFYTAIYLKSSLDLHFSVRPWTLQRMSSV